MKKTVIIMLAALTALVSCHKEVIIESPAGDETATEITINLTATHPDGDGTKAVKTGWETGDVILVFFVEKEFPMYLSMNWNGTEWEYTRENKLTLTDGEQLTMRAVYTPFGASQLGSFSQDNGCFIFRDVDNNASEQETYYLTATLSCTITGGELKGNFDMKIPDGYVQFFVNDPYASPSPTVKVEIREPKLTPRGIAKVMQDGTIVQTKVVHGAPLRGYCYDKENKDGNEEKGWLFSGILDKDARGVSKDYRFTFFAENSGSGIYRTISFSGRTLYRGEKEGRALLLPGFGSWDKMSGYLPVDVGSNRDLGNGEYRRVYWASRNLGATADGAAENTDEARKAIWGDYYAWGAKEPYYKEGHAYDSPMDAANWKDGITGYNWASYPFMTDGQSDWQYINKYTIDDGYYMTTPKPVWYNDSNGFQGDNQTVLLPEHDAAREALGEPWRMPTIEDWKALNGCWKGWVDTHRGYLIKGNGDYVAREFILPAAGYRNGAQFSGAGEFGDGYYWSSSLFAGQAPYRHSAKAYVVVFTSGGVSSHQTQDDRYKGLSIRPVMD